MDYPVGNAAAHAMQEEKHPELSLQPADDDDIVAEPLPWQRHDELPRGVETPPGFPVPPVE